MSKHIGIVACSAEEAPIRCRIMVDRIVMTELVFRPFAPASIEALGEVVERSQDAGADP
jgi:hypothetical protein